MSIPAASGSSSGSLWLGSAVAALTKNGWWDLKRMEGDAKRMTGNEQKVMGQQMARKWVFSTRITDTDRALRMIIS